MFVFVAVHFSNLVCESLLEQQQEALNLARRHESLEAWGVGVPFRFGV